jgi:hypothetical protein
MRTLSEDGWRLVRAGVTTAEEVLRVTKDQSLMSGGEESVVSSAIAVQSQGCIIAYAGVSI